MQNSVIFSNVESLLLIYALTQSRMNGQTEVAYFQKKRLIASLLALNLALNSDDVIFTVVINFIKFSLGNWKNNQLIVRSSARVQLYLVKHISLFYLDFNIRSINIITKIIICLPEISNYYLIGLLNVSLLEEIMGTLDLYQSKFCRTFVLAAFVIDDMIKPFLISIKIN